MFTSKHKNVPNKYALYPWLSAALWKVCPALSTPLTQNKSDQVRRVIPRRSHELTADHLHSYAKNTRLTKRQLPRNLTSRGTSPCILQLTILEKVLHFLQMHCQYASIFHNLKCTWHVQTKTRRTPSSDFVCQHIRFYFLVKTKK